MLDDAWAAGCDTFVTADVKYDVFLRARELGLNLMDAGHYATEQVVCPPLARFLQERFPALEVRLTGRHRRSIRACRRRGKAGLDLKKILAFRRTLW